MAVVYTAIGVYMLVNPNILRGLVDSTYTPVIGGLVLAYGLFRGYNVLKIEKNENKDN
ncbi:MAG: hypothetical protein K0R51_3127 [Cytophagaceae bacterium]|jgi:hypothetical protein|nr:hypothetical protein [Cytophagaceae bacterium]